MKLFILFSENIEFDLPESNYIILSKFKSHSSRYGHVHEKLEDVHVNDIDFLKQEELIYDEYTRQLPKSLADVFISSKTSLYFVMMALENWKITVKRLIEEYSIEEIVFTELLDQNFYMPFYEAEGEVTKPLQYEAYDFISKLLYGFINRNYPRIEVNIIKKHSVLTLRKRILARRYGLFIYKVLLQAKLYFKLKINSAAKIKDILFLSRGLAHSQYIVDYVREFNEQSDIYASDGLRTQGKNKEFLRNSGLGKDDYIDNIETTSFLGFLASVWFVLALLLKYKIVYQHKLKRTDKKYGFPYSNAVTEMIIHSLEAQVYTSGLERLIKRQKKEGARIPKTLITCEIYTQYAYFIAELGKKYDIKTIQLISVAMSTGYLPHFFFCDQVLFNQRKVLEAFKSNNQYLAHKCDYWGNLTFNECGDIHRKDAGDGVLRVVQFTQPVLDEENDFAILDTLLDIKNDRQIEITVKPHPRESPEKFSNYDNEVQICSSTISLQAAIENADLALVKFSAVEHYLLNYGIPTIYCAFSQMAKNGISEVIKTGYKGIAFSAEELKELVVGFPGIVPFYKDFRENEMFKRFENKGIYYFRNSLLKYINE
ncbi:hypothetical protein [Mucilaginibacter flavidus]|uniref:hypothetical protein n=1 Tax=Mucilaginibacter flavidus TaxID=2949309 RepID=UPI00209251E0|nr:hypothetical protein [Mucilaginibacter flavidus]MCO5949297.1 hypothetical protein [Mucilaginibacter flavidus]